MAYVPTLKQKFTEGFFYFRIIFFELSHLETLIMVMPAKIVDKAAVNAAIAILRAQERANGRVVGGF